MEATRRSVDEIRKQFDNIESFQNLMVPKGSKGDSIFEISKYYHATKSVPSRIHKKRLFSNYRSKYNENFYPC